MSWDHLVARARRDRSNASDPRPRRARRRVQGPSRCDQPAQSRAARARVGRRGARFARRDAHLTFVFVGAGYAGVEALAELSDLVLDALRYYPRLREARQRWVLVDAAPKILPEIPPRLGDVRGTGAHAARGGDPRLDDARVGHRERSPALERRANRDAHARVDGRREERTRPSASSGFRSTSAVASASIRSCASRDTSDSGHSATGRPCRTRPRRASRPTDLPARAPPGTRAREEPHRRAAAILLPNARPGGDARPLQGDCGRARNTYPWFSRLVRHPQLSPLPAAAGDAEDPRRRRLDDILFFRRDIAELSGLGHPHRLE